LTADFLRKAVSKAQKAEFMPSGLPLQLLDRPFGYVSG
jgi:hypothetical protein